LGWCRIRLEVYDPAEYIRKIMNVLRFIHYETRRIIFFAIMLSPIICLLLLLSVYWLAGIQVKGLDYSSFAQGMVLIELPMVVYFPIYIPFFLLLPTYHKYGKSYSYRKLFRRKKITADRIDRIKNAEHSPVYKIYIKGEIFPL